MRLIAVFALCLLGCVGAAHAQNDSHPNLEAACAENPTRCEEIRAKVGVLMFEFTRFWPSDYEHGRDFVSDLDGFLGKLPKGWPYAVEIHNHQWLREEYFGCLTRLGATHVSTAGMLMPPVSEQMAPLGDILCITIYISSLIA